MKQSNLFDDEIIADEEFTTINEHTHIEKVWEVMSPVLKENATRYASRMQASGVHAYIKRIINEFQNEQRGYFSFFAPGWDQTGNYKEFKKHLRLQCPAFVHALQSRTRVLNDWKASFYAAEAEDLYHVIKNIYDFNIAYDSAMSDETVDEIKCWEDNGLLDLVDKECYLNKVVGPGVESAILYHLNPRLFPGVYKLGIFSLYFLSGRAPIEMPSETSEFIMVKDAVRSRTGIIESDHNYFFPYQVYAYYALRIYKVLCGVIQNCCSMQFPNKWRYVLTSDFFSMIIDDNREMLQTLMGNDDILKYEMMEYY